MDQRRILLILLLEMWHLETMCACTILVLMMLKNMRRNRGLIERRSLNNRSFVRHENRLRYLNSILGNDRECVSELRMDLKTFGLLCDLLRTDGRLKNDGLVTVEEQVCMFLHMLAHHVKNRTIRNRFVRSGETISRYFNSVLQGILRLQGSLLRVPEPVGDNCTDHRWKWFKHHKEAAEWRSKPFPLFDRLSNIFGKDRANGQRAEAPADMMEEQSNNDVNASDNCVQEDASPMSLNIEGSQSMNSQNKRKRATSSSDEEKIVTVLEKLFEASGKRMQMVTEAIIKGNEDRSDIAKELKRMGFSPLDQIAALKLILEKPQNISIFMSLDDDIKKVFVEQLLSDNA